VISALPRWGRGRRSGSGREKKDAGHGCPSRRGAPALILSAGGRRTAVTRGQRVEETVVADAPGSASPSCHASCPVFFFVAKTVFHSAGPTRAANLHRPSRLLLDRREPPCPRKDFSVGGKGTAKLLLPRVCCSDPPRRPCPAQGEDPSCFPFASAALRRTRRLPFERCRQARMLSVRHPQGRSLRAPLHVFRTLVARARAAWVEEGSRRWPPSTPTEAG
jgi:hypothetical protein